MNVLLDELSNRDIKDHYIGWFGSYAWASKAVTKIAEWNENHLHFTPVGTPVEIRQSLDATTTEQCVALGREMAKTLLQSESL